VSLRLAARRLHRRAAQRVGTSLALAERAPCVTRGWRAAAGDAGPDHILDTEVVAVDLLKRTFGPGAVELSRVFVGDVTCGWTWKASHASRH
jgi:hypothetical protein